MRFTLRQLEIFAAIAQTGSTTAAADKVALSQSAVSAAIKELERVLEVPLFDRVGKRLLLNDYGRHTLPEALALLSSAETLEQACLRESPGLLHIGASRTIGNYLLPGLLAAYWRSQGLDPSERIPPVQVVVANTAEVVARVENFEVDIGLVEGLCRSQTVHSTRWIEDDLLLVTSPTHPLVRVERRGKRVTASRLAEANWLLREPGSGTREALEQALLPRLHRIRSSIELSDHEAIKHAAAEGLGIACLSRWAVADMLESGRLVALETEFGSLRRDFYLVRHKRKQMTPSLQRLLDFLHTGQRSAPPRRRKTGVSGRAKS